MMRVRTLSLDTLSMLTHFKWIFYFSRLTFRKMGGKELSRITRLSSLPPFFTALFSPWPAEPIQAEPRLASHQQAAFIAFQATRQPRQSNIYLFGYQRKWETGQKLWLDIKYFQTLLNRNLHEAYQNLISLLLKDKRVEFSFSVMTFIIYKKNTCDWVHSFIHPG